MMASEHLDALEKVTKNPAFKYAVDELRLMIAVEMLETADKDARDALYYESKALSKLTGRMQAMLFDNGRK